MRVVLDTGILIAALITSGTPPDAIYRAWRKKRFELIYAFSAIPSGKLHADSTAFPVVPAGPVPHHARHAQPRTQPATARLDPAGRNPCRRRVAAPLHLARADAAGEREALARVIHELQALEPLLRAAQSQSNPDARVRFRYDWLRQDLQRLRLGIQEHINAPRTQPRSFPPLRGDYRR